MSHRLALAPVAEPDRVSSPRTGEVCNESGFAALADAWNAVAQTCRQRSIFLRHEWFAAAWAWRQHDSALNILTLANAGHLAGVLPLVRPVARTGGTRRIELLTVPDTQFADMLAKDGDAASVADAFADALIERKDWDVAHFDYLRSGSAVVEHLVPALRHRGLAAGISDRGTNYRIALDGTWSDYYATRSRRLKKAVNLAANRLNKAGTIRIDQVAGSAIDAATFERAMQDLVDVSRQSWKLKTGTTLDQAGPQAFIRTLSASARDRGWLSMWLLYLDGRPQAIEYQLAYEGDVHALRADFVADTDELSPGTHLFRQLLESLFGGGLLSYYLGPGDNPYKKRWTDEGEPMQRVLVYNRTWRGQARRFRDEMLKPALRALRSRFEKPPVDAAGDTADDKP